MRPRILALSSLLALATGCDWLAGDDPVTAGGAAAPGSDATTVTPPGTDGATEPADGGPDAPADAAAESSGPAECAVSFTVTQATVTGGQKVYVVGNTPALGSWSDASAIALTEQAAGTWSGSVVLANGGRVEFKFLKRNGRDVDWEDWGANSNRSLFVTCTGSGGPSYSGAFDVKPPDATN